MTKRTIELKHYSLETAIRAGDFELMPSNPALPFVASQPIKNIRQYTYLVGVNDGIPEYQSIKPTFNVIRMLRGTAFSFETIVTDPSNLVNRNSTQNLTFKWKKDESQVFDVNRLNGGTGVPGISIDEESCTPFLNGRWICEISNNFGTIETQPLDLEVVDPLIHPKLYKNLILNPDGEGGLSNWQGDNEITTAPFLNSTLLTKNFGSFRLGDFITFNNGETTPAGTPGIFRFSSSDNYGHFYRWYLKRLEADPSFSDPLVRSNPTAFLSDGEQWMSSKLLPQIVANEDYNFGEYAGFFPGVRWMDSYNKNNGLNLIGLTSELKNYTPTYFTRSPIRFEKYGGKALQKMTQTIDINDLSDFVDGGVYGVQYLTSQFFAYVGIGITDYKIIVQTTEGEKEFNYYVADSEQVYTRVISKVNLGFPEAATEGPFINGGRYTLLPGSDIKIVPKCYDRTFINLTYLDTQGRNLKSEQILGPSERDIWALKEKTYFPLTLFGLFEFVRPDNNPIKVFDQVYTNTNALVGMFEGLYPNPGYTNILTEGLLGADAVNTNYNSRITDKAALHLLNKYDWLKWKTPYPGDIWYSQYPSLQFKALPDYGAAAMIAVGKDIIIPKKTRAVRVEVNFNHGSSIIKDKDPALKGWTSQELYTDDYGQSTGTSRRLSEYGNPRCGITKMKLMLYPNNVQPSEEYLTYSLPPDNATVLGLQKLRYQVSNTFNTADASTFTYNFVQPDGLPEPPLAPNPFILAKNFSEYVQSLQNTINAASQNVSDSSEGEETMMSSDAITLQEDADLTKGDFNTSLGLTDEEAKELL